MNSNRTPNSLIKRLKENGVEGWTRSQVDKAEGKDFALGAGPEMPRR